MANRKSKTVTAKRSAKFSFTEFKAQYGAAYDEGRKADIASAGNPFAFLNTASLPNAPNVFKNLNDAKQSSHPAPWDAIKKSYFADLLKRAERENNPEAFKILLRLFLMHLNVSAPEGVFDQIGNRGARLKDQTVKAHEEWVKEGRPKKIVTIFLHRVAQLHFPLELAKATKGTKRYKNLMNKIRSGILRREKQVATKSIS